MRKDDIEVGDELIFTIPYSVGNRFPKGTILEVTKKGGDTDLLSGEPSGDALFFRAEVVYMPERKEK